MMPALIVFAAWLLFGGSHLLLSSSSLRAAVSERLGDVGFVVFFVAVAAITMIALIVSVALVGDAGFPGPDLARFPVARGFLGAAAFLGAALASAGLCNYSRSPMAVLARRWRSTGGRESRPLAAKGAVEALTHHPFFAGLALLTGSHVLLASTLAQAVFFAGFVVLGLAGMPLQDRKLVRRHGDVYTAYLNDAGGSFRTRLRLHLFAAIAGAAAIGIAHPLWEIGNGAGFAAAVLVGGLYAVARQMRAAARG